MMISWLVTKSMAIGLLRPTNVYSQCLASIAFPRMPVVSKNLLPSVNLTDKNPRQKSPRNNCSEGRRARFPWRLNLGRHVDENFSGFTRAEALFDCQLSAAYLSQGLAWADQHGAGPPSTAARELVAWIAR